MNDLKRIIAISLLLCIITCCSDKDGGQQDSYPEIYSFSPLQGTEGTMVTLTGSNFSSNNNENIVTMGTVSTVVSSSASYQLLFKVPAGLNPGNYQIKVEVDGSSAISGQYFTVLNNEVLINDPDVLNFNYTLGTQTIGPSYGFTSEDRLIETAKEVRDMGSNILKISLSTGSYSISGRSYPDITALVRDDPSFSTVLDMPFTYYFFWARSNSNWADGYSYAERTEDSMQFANLTTYLLTKYNNSGKQFFLGHWEGDWYLLPNYDPSYVPSDARINGMIQWYRTRQNAVDESERITIHHNVNVYTYCEVNRVVDAMNGFRRVVNFVLPFTNVDYVSYSSYDAQGMNQVDYNSVLNYIQGNMPPKTGIEGKRVFIGEMGRCAQDFGFSQSQHEQINRENIRKAVLWGAPFILYWEMYNNEIKDNVQRGFWLIDNANTKWQLYNTYFNFYRSAKQWVYSQKLALNRLPTREEYMTWAYSKLANP